MKTGHVEKTNDRDYEVEERCVHDFLHNFPSSTTMESDVVEHELAEALETLLEELTA